MSTFDAVGGAPRFRDFLIGDLRQQLATEYRVDPRDHGLAGHSAGATFAGFTLFTKPGDFTKYILCSPSGAVDLAGLEAEYAEGHDDLEARVFVAAGGDELTDYAMASSGIWSAMAFLHRGAN